MVGLPTQLRSLCLSRCLLAGLALLHGLNGSHSRFNGGGRHGNRLLQHPQLPTATGPRERGHLSSLLCARAWGGHNGGPGLPGRQGLGAPGRPAAGRHEPPDRSGHCGFGWHLWVSGDHAGCAQVCHCGEGLGFHPGPQPPFRQRDSQPRGHRLHRQDEGRRGADRDSPGRPRHHLLWAEVWRHVLPEQRAAVKAVPIHNLAVEASMQLLTDVSAKTLVQLLAEKDAKAAEGPWVPACGGTEVPFTTRNRYRLLYCWQPSTGRHAYLNLDTDIILTDEEARLALGV